MTRAQREALMLGLLHGPVELLPVSSSAHVAAIPWLLGWEVDGWDPAARKELEVALHAGTGAALLLSAATSPRHAGERRRARGPAWWAAALAPAALAGLAWERPIERRLRGPRALAAGLLAGAVGLALGDRALQRRPDSAAGQGDALWLGLAQACALVPGVSRSGATLAAARARGFTRPAASTLSWEVGLPVLVGAGGLKTVRVLSGGDWRARGPALGAAAGAACASTIATAGAVGLERRAPLWRWAAWRAGLAASILLVGKNRLGD